MSGSAGGPGAVRTWAAVPFKGPAGSKRRLAGLLDADERGRLSLAMLDGVLDALLGVPAIERVLLLTPAAPDNLGRADGRLTVVPEPGLAAGPGVPGGLNPAVRHAGALARQGGAHRLLVMPGDLPLVTPADVAAMLDAAELASVAVAPDRAGDGTNTLLLAPPDAIAPCFGEGSFARHRALAETAGIAHAVVRRPGLALDLDRPEDVAFLLASGPEHPTTRLLRSLGVERRLSELLAGQARSTTI
jgi:2-phospho-L-lactate guanylyltransferase